MKNFKTVANDIRKSLRRHQPESVFKIYLDMMGSVKFEHDQKVNHLKLWPTHGLTLIRWCFELSHLSPIPLKVMDEKEYRRLITLLWRAHDPKDKDSHFMTWLRPLLINNMELQRDLYSVLSELRLQKEQVYAIDSLKAEFLTEYSFSLDCYYCFAVLMLTWSFDKPVMFSISKVRLKKLVVVPQTANSDCPGPALI